MVQTFDHHDFEPAALVNAKADRLVSVCLPAHNEETTVGSIVTRIREMLVERLPLVDEIVVIDDHSRDATARVAADAGARVVEARTTLAEFADGPGKGKALWKSVHASEGDIVVWCDADVTNFGPHFVTGLLGPLLTRPDVAFVKGYYRRPLSAQGDGGGRVTELVARPLMSMFFPELTAFMQPLSGEYAGRRELLEQMPFLGGYGVEVGLLIDIWRTFGTGVMAQVDLGTRVHRNRTLDQLGPQAMTIMQTILRRVQADFAPAAADLLRPGHPPRLVTAEEMPALAQVSAYVEARKLFLKQRP